MASKVQEYFAAHRSEFNKIAWGLLRMHPRYGGADELLSDIYVRMGAIAADPIPESFAGLVYEIGWCLVIQRSRRKWHGEHLSIVTSREGRCAQFEIQEESVVDERLQYPWEGLIRSEEIQQARVTLGTLMAILPYDHIRVLRAILRHMRDGRSPTHLLIMSETNLGAHALKRILKDIRKQARWRRILAKLITDVGV